MDSAGLFFIWITINGLSFSTGIKCFNCAVTTEILTIDDNRIVTPSCSNFNGSSLFTVDCPYSTMCSRLISTIYLQNGYEQKTLTLQCAQQKKINHVLIKGKWKEEYSVEEIYTEGCKTLHLNNLVAATKTYCYCRGDLCNSAHHQHANVYSLLAYLFILFFI
ncbi:uncharacterized protein ACRADG_013199 [Cochliomyia hominivorax]